MRACDCTNVWPGLGTLPGWVGPVCQATLQAHQTRTPGWCPGPATHPGTGRTTPVPGAPRLLTGSLWALAQATLGIAEACVHGGAAPGSRLGAVDEAEAEPTPGTCCPTVDKAASQPPSLPAERLEVGKLGPAFLLQGRGTWGAGSPHTGTHIHCHSWGWSRRGHGIIKHRPRGACRGDTVAQAQTAGRPPHRRRRHAFLGGTSEQCDLGGLSRTKPELAVSSPVSLQLRDHVLERECVRPMGTPLPTSQAAKSFRTHVPYTACTAP